MARNVALSNKAYEELSKRKGPNDSYSDVVLKLLKKNEKPSWRNFVGTLKDDEEALKAYDRILEERHKKKSRGPRFKW